MSQAVPKYSLHKASGHAFVYLQRKPHYLGKHGSPESKAKYQAIVGKWMLEQSRGAPDTPNLTSPLTLSELCDIYMAYIKERYYGRRKCASLRNRLFPVFTGGLDSYS